MAGITLAQAQAQLDLWLNASTAIGGGGVKSVTVNGRQLTYQDLPDIGSQIDYWNRWVLRLSRGSGVTRQRVVVHG